MRNHLEKRIYQYTSVFNDQLNNEPAAVAPFKLNLKPNSNWEESTANKAPPRSQILDSNNDQEMRNHLEKWIYQFTSVFNDQLNNEPAAVAPFKLNFNEQDANL